MILTVKDLAERWACSKFHIYDLCKNKRIPYFSIGLTDHKGYRFRLSDIEKYECTNSQNTEENTVSTGGTQSPSKTVIDFLRDMARDPDLARSRFESFKQLAHAREQSGHQLIRNWWSTKPTYFTE